MLTFRDSNKSLRLDGDLLETMTNYDFNISHSNPEGQKLIYEFGKEMKFNTKQKGQKVIERDLLKNYSNRPLLWLRGLQQYLYQKILMNYVID